MQAARWQTAAAEHTVALDMAARQAAEQELLVAGVRRNHEHDVARLEAEVGAERRKQGKRREEERREEKRREEKRREEKRREEKRREEKRREEERRDEARREEKRREKAVMEKKERIKMKVNFFDNNNDF